MPLKGKTKRDIVSEFRHAEILEAARRVFGEKGFNEASVEDIAQAAGIGKGTLYLYYPSKRDIYWEALRCGLAAFEDELERQVGAQAGTEEKVRAYIVTKLTYFEENRGFFRIYYAEFEHALSQPAFYCREIKDYHQRQVRLLKAALQDGMKRRSIRNLPPEATAFAIAGLTRGVIIQRLLGWAGSKVEDDAETVFDLTWKGLAGR